MQVSRHCRCLFLTTVACSITACISVPDNPLTLSESALEIRQIQTREYDAITDVEILSASMAVLQDMGYALDEIEKELGVLSASKRADASNELVQLGSIAADAVKCVFTLMLGCTGGFHEGIDDVQDIRLTLITRPKRNYADDVSVRVTIQRIVWDTEGRVSSQDTINEPDVYMAFFDKLSTAVFLEKEGL